LSGLRTIAEEGGKVVILDQTRLPGECVFRALNGLAETAEAIRVMRVRGAPLIGATAAYGVALGLGQGIALDEILATLAATRPTAVNLRWALDRMARVLMPLPAAERTAAAWPEARAIAAEDEAANAAIGRHGLAVLETLAHRPIRVMTHCNAGGLPVRVWVSETRPRNQGLLTAWELAQAGVAHTLIADNAAGLLLMRGQVDAVIVGADRIAANGDTANKVGTYLKALAAAEHGIPFYVAAPISTIDFDCPDGGAIPIEERAAAELGAGDVPVANPAFDVTPARYIAGIVTERGVFPAGGLEAIRP
jgi:methylthioribose-1-phosphate isomerase